MTDSELTETAAPDGRTTASGAVPRTAPRARTGTGEPAADGARAPYAPASAAQAGGRAASRDTAGPAEPPGIRESGPRGRCFDAAVRAYLARRPEATVVALGEGLGTGYWRLDNGRLHWLSVLSPRTAAVRRMLLPDGPRRRTVVRPASGHGWLDAVPAPERGAVVTAPGLLMRLAPHEVRALLAACAERLPGGVLVFDALPHGAAALARRCGALTGGRVFPPVRWGLDRAELPRLERLHPGIAAVRELPLPAGRLPMAAALAPYRHRLWGLRELTPLVCEVRFAGGARHGAGGCGRR